MRERRRLWAGGGRAGIERLAYAGHAPVLTAEQGTALGAELPGRTYPAAKAVCGFVAERFGHAYTPHAMAKLLGRPGFVWKRPKRIPAKADPGSEPAPNRRAFLETTLAPLMAAAEADPAQPPCFVDATHPACDAHPACGWIRRGEARTLKSKRGRVNVTLNGALSWPAREVLTREAAKITGPEMVAFFEQIAARYPLAAAITLVLDIATCNLAAAVREWLATPGCRVRFVYLPPYALNLNLIERLWWFFKKALWNTRHPMLADFKAAIRDLFGDLRRWETELAPIVTNRFHLIGAERTQVPAA